MADLYAEVIGVVEHMRILDLTQAVRPQIWSLMLGVGGTFDVVVRTDSDPSRLSPAVRQLMSELDPEVAVDRLRADVGLRRRWPGAGASQPRADVGVRRRSAGARRRRRLRRDLVLGWSADAGDRHPHGARRESRPRAETRSWSQGLRLIVPSLCIGAAGAWVLSHFIGGLLYETNAADPLTFAATVALLLVVALAGLLRSGSARDHGQSAGGVENGLEPRISRTAIVNKNQTGHGPHGSARISLYRYATDQTATDNTDNTESSGLRTARTTDQTNRREPTACGHWPERLPMQRSIATLTGHRPRHTRRSSSPETASARRRGALGRSVGSSTCADPNIVSIE